MSALLGNSYLDDHPPLAIASHTPELRNGPFLAPKLPPPFVTRSAELAELREHLTSGVRSVALTPAHGLSGIGLRTLAAAVCHDSTVCHTFAGGILWADVSQAPERVLADWCEALGVEGDSSEALRDALAERRCLLVLVGVNDPRQLIPYALAGPDCTNLVLTTHPDVAARAAIRRRVGVLHPDHAVDVLQEWAGDDDAPRQTVSKLAWQLGYQALPLALIGAMVPVLGGWWRTLEAVETQQVDLSRTQELNPAERLTQIYAVFNLCFATLSAASQAKIAVLAGLMEAGTPLTLDTIGAAWAYDTRTPEGREDTNRAVNALRRRALLEYDSWQPTPALRMHHLLRGYCLRSSG